MKKFEVDIIRLFRDRGVRYMTEGSKHCQPGWIQINCPFCHGNDAHLGYCLEDHYFNCWRCGWKPHTKVIEELLRLPEREAKELLKSYSLRPGMTLSLGTKKKRAGAESLELPFGAGPLTKLHVRYLEQRKYDAEEVARTWGLCGTGPLGDYKWRIIAPITLNGQLVSFQGRDVSGVSDLRYKACAKELEVVDHHHVVYGLDKVPGQKCLVVEGITDAWRLGPGAVATFGIKFSHMQVKLLAQMQQVFVMYDAYPDIAKVQAEKLAGNLSSLGVSVELLELEEGDPGEMPQAEANALMRELGLRKKGA